MNPPLKTNFNGNKIHLMFSKTKNSKCIQKIKNLYFLAKQITSGKSWSPLALLCPFLYIVSFFSLTGTPKTGSGIECQPAPTRTGRDYNGMLHNKEGDLAHECLTKTTHIIYDP